VDALKGLEVVGEPPVERRGLGAARRVSCGNCTRCAYLAVSLDAGRLPRFEASRCIGCSLCVQKCFTGALEMRDRTAGELAAKVAGA
jgi:MinD superfamily P-loop ATPase